MIGPLVVAGISINRERLPRFAELGVKDSKLLTARKREELFPKILELAENSAILKVSPQEIDQVVESQRRLHKLNRLEALTMAKIIDELKPEIAYVDAADVVEKRFGQHILEASNFKPKLVSEHKADRNYPIVSAASVVAKVERDRAVETLRGEFGDFGTGYLTDPKTGTFLKTWLKSHPELPACVRKSWKPAKLAKAQQGTEQMKLF